MGLLQKMGLSKSKEQTPLQNKGSAASAPKKKVSPHDNGGCCGSCGGQKESDSKGDKS